MEGFDEKGRSHRIGKADGADCGRKDDWILKKKKTWNLYFSIDNAKIDIFQVLPLELTWQSHGS